MNVKRVIPSGFCKGVVNAIKLAKKTKQEHQNENVYILGMLVHNSYVSHELAELGIIPVLLFALFPQIVLLLIGIFIVYMAVSKRNSY